jgi:lysophospholipase L1-like esterase
MILHFCRSRQGHKALTGFSTLLFLVIGLTLSVVADDFALRDGDTVAFLGDSITAARGYTKVVENYTLLRYPNRKIHFVNAGKGGDTAEGSLKRLESEVFAKRATVVTVAFGVNDIGWGVWADEAHKQRYLTGIREIVQRCQKRGMRVFICSPAITDEPPEKAEIGYLQKMTDEGMALAKSLGAGTIDIQRGMREIQRRIVEANSHETNSKNRTRLHVEDGVHLNDLGHLAMGFVMLKGLGAPAEVSSLEIDAKASRLVQSAGCRVSDIKNEGDTLRFVRLDEGLPLNLGILGGLQFRFIPIPEQLSRYQLKVINLAPGQYEIRAEGRLLGKVSDQKLAAGLNISSMTADPWEPGGPWDAQAGVLKELTDSRDKTFAGEVLRTHFMGNHPKNSQLTRQTASLDRQTFELQHAIARPYPYHFEIKPVAK